MKINIFWFRRDLRLDDNKALYHALKSGLKVLPVFIFDKNILDKLESDKDSRLSFIYDRLKHIDQSLSKYGSDLRVFYGRPNDVFEKLIHDFDIHGVFFNDDYEVYARERDDHIEATLRNHGILVHRYHDQIIFPPGKILKDDGKPYTVYTPFSRKWIERLGDSPLESFPSERLLDNCLHSQNDDWPALDAMGFAKTTYLLPEPRIDEELLAAYEKNRDIPCLDGTSRIGPHLRFGTISIRKALAAARKNSLSFMKELIWREFFCQIMWFFPHVNDSSFKAAYDRIEWINNPDDFARWAEGKTGYPLVDAGMRELNATGYMHNRVRMLTAGFLCKHLLIDWRWGERYFASRLMDYELSSNNGNWQWAAGSGCDAAPYFRIFNPYTQEKKFDPQKKYIRKWISEIDTEEYPEPLIEHKFARERCILMYKKALNP
jgi:deoxyribodipyrimidine photo-lyase